MKKFKLGIEAASAFLSLNEMSRRKLEVRKREAIRHHRNAVKLALHYHQFRQHDTVTEAVGAAKAGVVANAYEVVMNERLREVEAGQREGTPEKWRSVLLGIAEDTLLYPYDTTFREGNLDVYRKLADTIQREIKGEFGENNLEARTVLFELALQAMGSRRELEIGKGVDIKKLVDSFRLTEELLKYDRDVNNALNRQDRKDEDTNEYNRLVDPTSPETLSPEAVQLLIQYKSQMTPQYIQRLFPYGKDLPEYVRAARERTIMLLYDPKEPILQVNPGMDQGQSSSNPFVELRSFSDIESLAEEAMEITRERKVH